MTTPAFWQRNAFWSGIPGKWSACEYDVMLAHITPAVPPAANGLGDYCYKLWEYWPEPKPEWHCLAPRVSSESHSAWPQAHLTSVPPSRQELLQALEEGGATTVVLHYVGYGYHPKGCPIWLPQALGEWRAKPDRKLVVMFHELYAKGRVTQTSFWLAPVARKIMVDLAVLADHWVTSCAEYETRIIKEAKQPPGKGTVIPVGTNISPSHAVDFQKPWPLTSGQKLKIGVFGLPNTRLWALQSHKNLLRQLCEQDLVECISIIGKPEDAPAGRSATDYIKTQIGFSSLWRDALDLPLDRLSDTLRAQDLGVVSNWPGTVTKSGVYAALCAHGVVPVIALREQATTVPAAPCLINDEAKPEYCIHQLQNKDSVDKIKADVKIASEGLLNWNNITRQWTEIMKMLSLPSAVSLPM